MAAKRTRNPVRRTIEKPSKYIENSIVSVVFYFALNGIDIKEYGIECNSLHSIVAPTVAPFYAGVHF